MALHVRTRAKVGHARRRVGQDVELLLRGVPVGELSGIVRTEERAGLGRLETDPCVAFGVREVHHSLAVQDQRGTASPRASTIFPRVWRSLSLL